VLRFSNVISGLSPTVTLSTALSGGAAAETNTALLERILDRLQNPPAGATAAQYRIWCDGQTGVDRTYVYPLRQGTGTVDMVIAALGRGKGRQPSDDTVAVVQAFIDGVRPVAAEAVNVYKAYMPGNGHTIKARVVPTAGNEFDLTDAALTVSAYSGTSLTLSGAWSSLDTAVNTHGQQPRIQIATTTTGGNLVPTTADPTAMVTEQIKVTAYNPSTHVCTLAAPFTVAPTVGDSVYSGGNVVETISGNLSRHVDALGPSTAGGERIIIDGDGDPHTLPGFAYLQPPWNDTLVIDRIGAICLDATDANGATLCANIVRTAFVPQVFVDGASDNIRAGDDGTNPPELLFLKSINVIQ
jgi:hypothetical protein